MFVGGTRMLWMDTMWRSCAKLSGRLSRSKANLPALLPRHSRAEASKVGVVCGFFVFVCLFAYLLYQVRTVLWILNMRLICHFTVGIEDLENWHGKPIPKDRVDEILNDLQSQIQVPNKTLCPDLPNEDTAPADLSPISLASPPEYKKGDKVPSELLVCV